jgi:hypothetical protein
LNQQSSISPFSCSLSNNTVSTIVAAVVAVLVGAIVSFSGMTLGSAQLNFAISLGISAITLAPVVRRISSRNFNLFEPIISGSLMLFIIFGLRSIVIVLSGDILYKGIYRIDSHLTETLLVASLGCFTFISAYELTSLRLMKAESSKAVEQRTFYQGTINAYCLGLSSMAVLLFLAYLSLGGSVFQTFELLTKGRSEALHELSSSSSEYLSLAPNLAVCAAAILLLTNRSPSRLQTVLVIAAILFPSGIFFLIGNRRFILPALMVPLLIRYLMARKQPSRLTLAIVGPILLLAVATIPYARAQGAREAAGGVVPIFQHAFLHPQDTLLRTFTSGDDTEMLYALALEVKTLKSPGDFAYGNATVGDLLIAPIPSAVVPSKPATARNDLLKTIFGSPCKTVAGGLCPDFSVVGTFYQDFWLFGVAGGMASLGAFSSWTWHRYLEHPTSPYRIGLLACWIVFLPLVIRAGFMPAFSWFLYFSIPILIGLFIGEERIRKQIGSIHFS